MSTIILRKSVSQVSRKEERKFVWDNKEVFLDNFMHGNWGTIEKENIGAWRKQWGTFQ